MSKTVDQLVVEIRAETKKLRKGLDGVNKKLDQTGKKTKVAQNALKGFGAIVATIGISRLAAETVNTIRTFEDLEATLRAVTGSAESAATSFKLIRAFTATTTFQIDEVANAFIRLKQAGIIPTSAVLQDFGNLAAGMGRSIDQLAQAVFNATTGEMEMLKQFGVIAKLEGDKIKVTFDGTTKTIERSGESITEFLRSVGRESFGDALEQRAKTLSGAISNMKDASSEFMVAIGEGGLKDALADVSLEMKDLLMDNNNLAHDFGSVLGVAVKVLAVTLRLLLDNIKLVTMAFAFMLGASIMGSLSKALPTLIGLFNSLRKVIQGTAAAAILLQGVTGIGIAKVAGGLALAGTSLIAMNKLLDETDTEGTDATQSLAELDAELQSGMVKNEKTIDKVSKSVGRLSDAIKSIPKGKFTIFDQLKEMNLNAEQFKQKMSGDERDMFFDQDFAKTSPTQTMGIALNEMMNALDANRGLESFGFSMSDFINTVGTQTSQLADAINTNMINALKKSGFSDKEAGEIISSNVQKFFDDPDTPEESKSVAGYFAHILEQARGQSEAHVTKFYTDLFKVDKDFFEKNMAGLLDIPNIENIFGAVDKLGRESLLGTSLAELEKVLGDDGLFQGFVIAAKNIEHFIGMTDEQIRDALTEYIRLGKESMEIEPFAGLKGIDKIIFDTLDDAINGSDALKESLLAMTKVELEAKLLSLTEILGFFELTADQAAAIIDKLRVKSEETAVTLEGELGAAIQSLSLAFTNDFVDALAEGTDALDAFEDFAANIVKQIIAIFMQLAIVNKILNSIFPGLKLNEMDIFGADAFKIRENASGGTVQGGQPTLVGERGAEIFVPNTGGTIMNNMNSKNAMGGGGTTVINQSINFATGIIPTVRAEVMQMMPQIANVTKAAVQESAMRGGTFKRSLAGG